MPIEIIMPREARRISIGDGPAWIRTRLQIELFSRPWVHRWGHAVRSSGHL
jgi:hypothetical protein